MVTLERVSSSAIEVEDFYNFCSINLRIVVPA